ncbi:TonB-dependent receptor [Massilia solisilvae]
MAASAALAQEAAQAPMQRIEVTGSRIPTLNTEGASPITTLTSKDIKIDGPKNTEDLMNNLPQVFASQGAAISNGATGTATVDLRGMGAGRTLVLVNGKRLPSGSALTTAADLNEIPSQLIQRVEVLTGGAGAVYGSGAVAGVVNFIMKDSFEGVEFQANVSGSNHQQHSDEVQAVVNKKGFPLPGNKSFDGKKYDFSLLAGSNFADNKGNATFFVSHKHADALLQSERDYSACSLGASDPGFACSGSGTSIARINSWTPDASGNPRKYVSATDAYNFGPLNFFQRPSDQYNINSTLHYDINENARLYSDFNVHLYTTDAQIAPGGIFYGQQATLSYENPLLNSAWRTALGLNKPGDTATVTVGKRNVEGGPRNSHISDMSFREVLGVKGTIGGGWSYDVFGQFARVNHDDHATGYFSSRLITKALDVVADPKTGKPVCRSVVDGTDPSCVPYNLYTKGGITKEALDYLQAAGTNSGYTQQSVFGINLGNDLGAYGIKLPTAENGVGVSVGYEQRVEKLVLTPDFENQTGDLSGSGGPTVPVAGSYNVKETYGEIKVPLLDNAAFSKHLDLSASYRRSNYSTGSNTNTYGVGIDWQPVEMARVRGSVQRAARAPNIFELYTPQSVQLAGPTDDPCGGEKPKATQAQCANTGLPASLYGKVAENSTNQYNGRTGGNPNVQPETADTVTLGFVLDPMKNLTITVDAFRLKIKDAIQSVNAQSVFQQCLTTGNPLYCKMVHRDSLGSLWLLQSGYVEAGTTNIGSQGTSGVDLGASYRTKLAGLGGLDFTLNGTYVKTYTVENLPGMGEYDCAGLYGPTCNTPTPKWRHKFRTTWSSPYNFDLSLTWRYFDRVKNDMLDANPLLAGELDTKRDAYMASRSFIDLSGTYRFNKKMALSVGINNLLDKDPPIASSSSVGSSYGNGNTYPQVYDSYGRFVYANLTYRF